MKNFIRKIFTATVTTTLLLTILTSCGSSNTSSTSSNSSNNSSEQSQNSGSSTTVANTKDTIRLVISTEIDSLDPMKSAAADTAAIMMNVFEGLLTSNVEGELLPALAQSYEVLNDGLTYQFNLRENVKFHNGEDFTSADVVYTYNQLAGLNGYEAVNSTVSEVLESVEAIDDYTVLMNLSKHDSAFLTKCIASIVKDGYGNDGSAPNGTGPYKFVEYIHGEKVIFIINEEYNTTDKTPTVENIEVSIMSDKNSILLALKTGQLDIANILAIDIASLEAEYNIYNFAQNMIQYLALNNNVDGLDNVDVRRAINLAIDKKEIIELASFGAGIQLETFLSPIMAVYYNDDIPTHEQNIEMAKELITNAGYEGFTFNCRVPSNYPTHVDTAQVIKEQLAKINVNMEIELVEWATWLDEIYVNSNYDSTICAHSGKLDPMDLLGCFHSNYYRNFFNFSNSDFDSTLDKAGATYDSKELVEYYNEAQMILVDQAAAVFIQDPFIIYATTKDIDGLLNYPYRFLDFASLKFV